MALPPGQDRSLVGDDNCLVMVGDAKTWTIQKSAGTGGNETDCEERSSHGAMKLKLITKELFQIQGHLARVRGLRG